MSTIRGAVGCDLKYTGTYRRCCAATARADIAASTDRDDTPWLSPSPSLVCASITASIAAAGTMSDGPVASLSACTRARLLGGVPRDDCAFADARALELGLELVAAGDDTAGALPRERAGDAGDALPLPLPRLLLLLLILPIATGASRGSGQNFLCRTLLLCLHTVRDTQCH